MTKRVRNPKIIATIFIGTFFFVGVFMFFIMGGVDFGRKYPKVLNYANSTCQVDSRNYTTYECHSRYATYTCYGPIWNAHYGENRTLYAQVETEKRYESSSVALAAAKEYQIGMSYSCWYDTRNPSVAQWDKPSVLIQIILLGCGGLSVLLCILFFFLTYRLVQQEKLQNEQDGSYSDLFNYKINSYA